MLVMKWTPIPLIGLNVILFTLFLFTLILFKFVPFTLVPFTLDPFTLDPFKPVPFTLDPFKLVPFKLIPSNQSPSNTFPFKLALFKLIPFKLILFKRQYQPRRCRSLQHLPPPPPPLSDSTVPFKSQLFTLLSKHVSLTFLPPLPLQDRFSHREPLMFQGKLETYDFPLNVRNEYATSVKSRLFVSLQSLEDSVQQFELGDNHTCPHPLTYLEGFQFDGSYS